MPTEEIAKYCGGLIATICAILGVKRFAEAEICRKVALKLEPIKEDITEIKEQNKLFITEKAHEKDLLASQALTDQRISSIKDHFDIRFDNLIDRLDERRKEFPG